MLVYDRYRVHDVCSGRTSVNDDLVGKSFTVIAPSVMFPRDFTIVGQSILCLRIKNEVEEYTVSRILFHAAWLTTFVSKTE